MATCYRHPSRETGVSCSSCGNPICTDCMTTTPVGMRCPDCARQKTQVRTIRSVEHEPVVSYVLIAINVLAYFGSQTSAQAQQGALSVAGLYDGRWYQIVTSGFLHDFGSFGPIHIFFNMLLLYFLGARFLEPVLGPWKFGAIYFGSLLTGALGVVALSGIFDQTVGASGAVFGLMGAAVIVMRERGINIMQSGVGGLIILNLVLTFAVPRVSIGGHVGGLIGGALCGLLVSQLGKGKRSPVVPVAACVAVGIVAAVASIVVANERVNRGLRNGTLGSAPSRQVVVDRLHAADHPGRVEAPREAGARGA